MRQLYLIFSFVTCISCLAQIDHSITFNVDMNPIFPNLKDSTLNIGVRGSIFPLTWVKGIKLKDADGDGVYSTKVKFKKDTGTELYFKYVLNEVEWEFGDALKTELTPEVESDHKSSFRYVKQRTNPFKRFIGEWTLKEDTWKQRNGHGNIETLKIPNHYSLCKDINTDNSLLWIVDATSARGHIFWTYDDITQELYHNSSFYPSRIGLGKGNIAQNGDIRLKISFSGEPEGTYRVYSYTWVNDDEYVLQSLQHDASGKPTGDYYGGTFTKIKNENK